MKKISETSADVSEIFFCCFAARAAEGGTLAKQEVIFPTYMPPEKYLIISFRPTPPGVGRRGFVNSLGIFNGFGLAEEVDLDLTGVLKLLLDLSGDVPGEQDHLVLGYLLGLDHYAYLAPGLDSVARLNALEGACELLKLFKTLDVAFNVLAARAGTRGGDGVRRLDEAGDDGVGLHVAVVRLDGVHHRGTLFITARQLHAQLDMGALHLMIDGFAQIVQQTGALGELDVQLAKRAGLLHDLGKSVDHEMEGSHVQLGVELARRYKESPAVVHAIEAHHGDVEPHTIIACLVQAADTISAARPGARRENIESYIKRLEKLEELTSSFKGVETSYAIQAGREIRIMVKPEEVSEDEMVLLARDIARKIEQELEYPGQIKVNLFRETKAVEYAK